MARCGNLHPVVGSSVMEAWSHGCRRIRASVGPGRTLNQAGSVPEREPDLYWDSGKCIRSAFCAASQLARGGAHPAPLLPEKPLTVNSCGDLCWPVYPHIYQRIFWPNTAGYEVNFWPNSTHLPVSYPQEPTYIPTLLPTVGSYFLSHIGQERLPYLSHSHTHSRTHTRTHSDVRMTKRVRERERERESENPFEVRCVDDPA